MPSLPAAPEGPSPNGRRFGIVGHSRLLRCLIACCLGWMSSANGQAPTEVKHQDNSYVLRPNDSIKLDVYQEPDLSASVRILRTGEASFPLIGSLTISGLSVSQATAKIRDLYAADYLVDPKVTLTVTDYATEFVSILGAVKAPGQVPIPISGDLDIATAMASVGGLSETADPQRVLLVRSSGTSSYISLDRNQAASQGKVKLEGGDRIIVNQSAYVGRTLTILGQIARQGPLPFPPSGKLDLVSAIAMAGGLTDLANPRKLAINRRGVIVTVDYKQISEKGDSPFQLQPDDIITVPERLW
jgi:polysaccharide biosynthesis/export protein